MLSKYKTWDKTLLTFEFHLYLIFICCCFFFSFWLKRFERFSGVSFLNAKKYLTFWLTLQINGGKTEI